MATNTSPERHIAVFSFPFASHPSQLLLMVGKLAAAAPTATFTFFSTAKSNRSLFSAATPGNIRPYDVADGVPESYVFSGKPLEAINLFLAVAEEEFRRGVEVAELDTGKKVNCLLSDAFMWFSAKMAEEMLVPWVALPLGGTCSLSTHFYTDLIREKVGLNGIAGREDEVVDFIPGFSAMRLGDLPGGIVSGDLESPFSIMLHKMGQMLPKATAIPINSFQELDPGLTKDLNTKLKNILNIGPSNLTSPPPPPNFDEFACISWLDKHKPRSVAYICFGTAAVLPAHELVALAQALQEVGIPFLWSINDKSKKHLPGEFLKTANEIGKIVPWAPQVQVLAHNSVGFFVTHCGWNSVLESIGAGVAMIGRPFFGDQQIDSWMIEKVWEIGVRVEGGVFTKNATLRAVELILSEEKGRELKDRIKVLKELAHKAVGPNGSSTENFKTLVQVIANYNL